MVKGCTYRTDRFTSGVVNEVGMAPPGDSSPKYLLADVTPRNILSKYIDHKQNKRKEILENPVGSLRLIHF